MNSKVIACRIPRFSLKESIYVHFPEELNHHRPYMSFRGKTYVSDGRAHQIRSPHFEKEAQLTGNLNRKMSQEHLFKYSLDGLSEYPIEELLTDSETQEIVLNELNPMFYNIIRDLDSPVAYVFISDIHGAANKLFHSISLFPQAKLVSTGDIFDRADDQMATNYIFSTFHQTEETSKHIKETMGNHDAMVIGAITGELTSIAHYLRFALRYNEIGYLQKMGLDLSKLTKLAQQRNYKGNYKAKGDINYKLEALCTDLQLKLTYGEPSITLSKDEEALLHNLMFNGPEKEIQDASLQKIYRKIQAKLPLSDFESKVIERIKYGNNKLSQEEIEVLEDMQFQILTNPKFRELLTSVLTRFKMYETIELNEKTFLFFHSNIPTTQNGGMRGIYIDGKKYKGIELLNKIQRKIDEVYRKYEKTDPNDTKQRKEYLSWLEQQNSFFNWLAWSFDSPVYGRVMKTFERAYLPKESGLYDEPKDQWYKQIQTTNVNTYIAKSMVNDIAAQIGVHPDKLTIVNGHTPNKSGLIETFVNGQILRIDTGFSSAYGNLGAVTMLTEKGTIYSLSLSESDNIINKYTLHKVDEKGNVVKINNGI